MPKSKLSSEEFMKKQWELIYKIREQAVNSPYTWAMRKQKFQKLMDEYNEKHRKNKLVKNSKDQFIDMRIESRRNEAIYHSYQRDYMYS